MRSWDGTTMQRALLACEVASETKVTDAGPGELYYLKLADKMIPLGIDRQFADLLQFALVRNAESFERRS